MGAGDRIQRGEKRNHEQQVSTTAVAAACRLCRVAARCSAAAVAGCSASTYPTCACAVWRNDARPDAWLKRPARASGRDKETEP
eukprot:9284210-Heterocapsa_arctica.AAC.1